MKLALSSVVLSALLLSACSDRTSDATYQPDGKQTSIIGGEAVTGYDELTSSTVSLILQISGQPLSLCTGTLISEDLVLTAAHCLMASEELPSVYFGTTLPTEWDESQMIPVDEAVSAKYTPIRDEDGFISAKNDVALLKLGGKIPRWAKPVPVLDATASLVAGDRLILAGYGLVNELGEPVYATGLNKVDVPVAKLWEDLIVTDQTNAKGACAGDSGGPAYLKTSKGLVVVGATRGPHDRAMDCRHYGEYTDLTKQKAFIVEQAQQMGAQMPVFVGRD